MKKKVFIQLWRAGDVLNALPAAKLEFDNTGQKPMFLTHRDYISILDGVSYVEPVQWDGDPRDCINAINFAATLGEPFLMQVDGNPGCKRDQASFCLQSWSQVGMLDQFTDSLVIDRRDSKREKALVDRYKYDKPIVLVNTFGVSSPFPHRQEVDQLLASMPEYQVLDLSKVKAERLYDLLGLYDKAVLLVTIDTATLHLAAASDIPVICLLSDTRSTYHCSTPKGNTILSMKYSEFTARKAEIAEAIRRNSRNATHSKIHHVYQDFIGGADAPRRCDFARKTWETEYAFGRWCEHPVKPTRKGFRDLPYVKDIIDAAMTEALPNEYIVLTNTDTCFRKGLTHELRRLTGPAYYTHRWDFQSLKRPMTVNEIQRGKWYAGSDMFVFTKKWWLENRASFPDMLVGGEAWDKILRQLMPAGNEIHLACYHEKHASEWEKHRINALENRYNRILAKQFLSARNLPLGELSAFNDGELQHLCVPAHGDQGEPDTGGQDTPASPDIPIETRRTQTWREQMLDRVADLKAIVSEPWHKAQLAKALKQNGLIK